MKPWSYAGAISPSLASYLYLWQSIARCAAVLPEAEHACLVCVCVRTRPYYVLQSPNTQTCGEGGTHSEPVFRVYLQGRARPRYHRPISSPQHYGCSANQQALSERRMTLIDGSCRDQPVTQPDSRSTALSADFGPIQCQRFSREGGRRCIRDWNCQGGSHRRLRGLRPLSSGWTRSHFPLLAGRASLPDFPPSLLSHFSLALIESDVLRPDAHIVVKVALTDGPVHTQKRACKVRASRTGGGGRAHNRYNM